MNALIVNIPKGFWQDDWRHNFINVLPMGVFAIANYCNRRGHRVLVANAAGFGDRNAAMEMIISRIRSTNAEVLGMPLHWHLCGYDVLETAAWIRRMRPEIKIVVGGLTASVYPAEIMSYCTSLDAIVVGDGEVPFCRYLDALEGSREDPDLAAVPNLVWRSDGTVHDNGVSYVANSDQLSDLDFSPQGSIASLVEYSNKMRIDDVLRGGGPDTLHQPTREKLFFMNIGRGCSYNCIYCSGCALAHKQYFRRTEVTVRTPGSVASDFDRCYAAGFRRFHIAFDPAFADREGYFNELFDLLRRTIGNNLELVFEVYGLPSPSFLTKAAQSFAWVGLVLSPCFFNLEARKRYKGYYFDDGQLEQALAEILALRNCQGFVYFAVTGLESWSDDEIAQRIRHLRRLQTQYQCEISVLPIYAEPGSPWVSFPKSFGNRAFEFSFYDFLAEWQRPLTGWNDRLTGVEETDRVMRLFNEGVRLDVA